MYKILVTSYTIVLPEIRQNIQFVEDGPNGIRGLMLLTTILVPLCTLDSLGSGH